MDPEVFHGPGIKILVTDDSPDNLAALGAALEGLGQEVVEARSGREALRRILTDDFAVIILDVRMPGMDGLETAGLIRQRERSRDTPIIFLTAYQDDEKLIRGYDLGAVDYLIKPVQPAILKSKVAVFIELARKNHLLKSHAEALAGKNHELQAVIAQREQAEEEVRLLNRRLEERLGELRVVNHELEELYGKIRELDEIKTRFFANVSHEMRTPLTLMLGPTEKLLESGGLSGKQHTAVEALERHMRSMLKHVNDLLDISRLDAGKMEVSYSEADLAQIVQITAANFDGLAEARGISFFVEAPGSVPAQVDQEKVQRVLLNLLSNAFKFAPEGGAVRCSLRVKEERALITVADNGAGVPPENRTAIFERFREAPRSSSQRPLSGGLSLAIVREFVTLLGGAVGVTESEEGGAQFTVELPLVAPAGAQLRRASKLDQSGAASQVASEFQVFRESKAEEAHESAVDACVGEQGLVLFIDDNPVMCRFIADALAGDFRVETASDGPEGLAKALTLRPDLILSDVMMPGLGGEELLNEFRSHPELEGVPVVVATGRPDPQLCTKLLQAGAQDYLTKPFSVVELRLRLQNLIAVKRVRDLLRKELESRSQNLEQLAAELAVRRREAEAAHGEAEAANRAKDDFLAVVSHELRTPLTAVLGWVRLLRTRAFDEATMTQALEIIERNADMQARLIDEILEVSRIVSGHVRLESKAVDLTHVVGAAIDAIRPAAQANGIEISAVLDSSARPVSGDAGRLQQIVWNLLSNAVKYTPSGGRVDVRLTCSESQAEIEVRDTGRGISPDFLPYVFDRFRQADSSSTQPHAGLGLGLAIVKHFVELHGGKVRAESPGENLGSTFTITLPLQATAAADSEALDAAVSAPSGHGDHPLDGLHVLVVEDEADTREILSRVLGHSGAQVTAVASAAEGVEALHREPPDVILSDLQMPNQDGYALLRQVQELAGQRGLVIPAAALTAHTRTEDRARVLSAGFRAHLPKPIDTQELVTVVAGLAGRTLG